MVMLKIIQSVALNHSYILFHRKQTFVNPLRGAVLK